MAIEGDAARAPLSAGERVAGLNHIAALRAQILGQDGEPELARFIHAIRNPHDRHYPQNQRALAALFFMAKIPGERHGLAPDALTRQEKRQLVEAMNHFRAVVSLFPKRLTLPN